MATDDNILNSVGTPSKPISRNIGTGDKGLLDATKQARDVAKKFNNDIEKLTKASSKELTKYIADSYKAMYQKTLPSLHKAYINNWIKQEKKAVDTIVAYREKHLGSTKGSYSTTSYDSAPSRSRSTKGSRSEFSQYNEQRKRIEAFSEALNLQKELTGRGSSPAMKMYATKVAENSKAMSKLRDAVEKGMPLDKALISAKALTDSNENLSIKMTLVNGLVDTTINAFKSYLNIWMNRFQRGIDNIYSTYESTYTKVATLMDINYGQYETWQSEAKKSLVDQGLKNNIAISTVMKQLEATVGLGITGEKAKQKALADSINQTLAPFVSTTTSAYTDLQMKLGDPFVQAVTSMSANINRQVGSSRIIAASMNDVLTKLDPIMLNAQDDYASKHAGKALAMTEAMVASGALTQSDATKLLYNSMEGVTSPFAALTGGNISSILGLTGAKNMTNTEDVLLSTIKALADVTKGVTDPLSRDAILNAYGSGTSYAGDYTLAYQAGMGAYGGYNSDSRALYGTLLGRLSKDELTTETAQKNIYAENTMLGLGQFKQRNPDLFNILDGIRKDVAKMTGAILTQTVTSIIGNKLGGNGTGGLWGKISGGAGIKGVINNAKGLGSKALYSSPGLKIVNAGSKAYTGAANIGSKVASSMGGASGLGAATAGGAVAVTGGVLAYNEIKNAMNAGTTAQAKKDSARYAGGYGAGAALGAGSIAAVALGSNPVGWALAIAGGIALATTAIVKAYNKQGAAIENLNAAYETQISTMKENKKANLEELDVFKDRIKEAKTIDEKQALAIEAGFTESEVSKMTSARLDQLLDDFVKEQKKFEKEKYKSEKSALKEVQKIQAEEMEKGKVTNETLMSEKLDNLSQTEAVKYLENMGVKKRFIKRYQKGKYTASEAASKRGLFGGNTGYDNLDATTSNAMLDSLGITNGVRFKSEGDALTQASEFANAKTAVQLYQEKGISNLNAGEKAIYDQAYDIYVNKYNKTAPSGISGYASGLRYVPQDTTVNVHAGERILTAAENSRYLSSRAQMASILGYNNSNIRQAPVVFDAESIVNVIKETTIQIINALYDTAPTKDMLTLTARKDIKFDENLINLKQIFNRE